MPYFYDEASLLTLLPKTYRDADLDGSLQAFFIAVNNMYTRITLDMETFDSSVLTPNSDLLSYYLDHRGNPFVFPMTDDQKRLLVDGLFRIYQLRGSERGMLRAINYLLGITCTVEYDFEYCWKLGVSRLGVDTILLSKLQPNARLHVNAYQSDSVNTALRAIVEFMKPHWLGFTYIWETMD
jgi:phage tail-like protein